MSDADEGRYVYDPEIASDRERAAYEAGQKHALEDAADAAGAHTAAGTHVHLFYQAEEWLRDRARRVGTKDEEAHA